MPSSEEESTAQEEVTTPTPEPKKRGKKATAAKGKSTGAKKKRRHKPKDFPKRPLSAYNIFFKETRETILADNDGRKDIAFQTMAKEIASRWKKLDPKERERVDSLAKQDMKRYREEVKNYEEEMVKRSRKEREEENLRRVQAAEMKAEEDAANEAASLGTSSGDPSGLGKGPAAYGAPAGGLGLGASTLEQQLSGQLSGSGLNLDALRREQMQMRLLEELRSLEARAAQVRQLQSSLGLSSDAHDLLQAQAYQNSGGLSSLMREPSMLREPAMSDYEMLLRHQAGAGGFAPGPSSLPAGLLNLQGSTNLGGLGGSSNLGGLGGSGLGGYGGLNAGILSQLQGLGGLSSLQAEQGPDLKALFQNGIGGNGGN